MPTFFNLNQSSANWYLANTIAIVLILFFAFVGQKSKRGIVPDAVITPMTTSSDEKWKQVQKFRAIIVYILFIPLLIVNIIFSIIDKEGAHSSTISILIIAAVLAYFIILTVYTDILERRWLAEQKKKGHPVSDFEFAFPGVSKRSLIIGLVILIVIIIAFFVLQYVFHSF